MGHLPSFSNLPFSTLIIFDVFSQNKVFIVLMVIRYKHLCKNVTLRGQVFFLEIILQLPLTVIVLLK